VNWRRSRTGLTAAAILGLAACAHAPQPAAPEAAPLTRSIATGARERLAQALTSQGRLADALVQWKVLLTIDPDNTGYVRQLGRVEQLIKTKTSEYLRAGDAALARGDSRTARTRYLATLAIDPANGEALDQLRNLEFERVWSVQSAKLEKLKETADRATAGASEQERFYFELAALLYRQGEYADSVREMQKYLNSYPKDAQARKLMADAYGKLAAQQREQGQNLDALSSVEQARRFGAEPTPALVKDETAARNALANEYYEKGLRLQRTNLAEAIEAFEKALSLNPNHTKARAKLSDSLRMQKNLKAIGK
jgi:tetratricopeptide (TPR) repeat protein